MSSIHASSSPNISSMRCTAWLHVSVHTDAFLPNSGGAHGASLLLLDGGNVPPCDRVVQSRDEEVVILVACCVLPGFYVRVIFDNLSGWLYWPREGDRTECWEESHPVTGRGYLGQIRKHLIRRSGDIQGNEKYPRYSTRVLYKHSYLFVRNISTMLSRRTPNPRALQPTSLRSFPPLLFLPSW